MSKLVAVTGANGFVASSLIKSLLEKGYKVLGTVRNVSDENKTAHLRALPKSENLKLVEASFEGEQNDFVSAFEGVDCVFHTANPVSFEGGEPALVDVPVKGTEKIIQAVEANRNSIKNLICTSSTASCMSFTEAWSKDIWSDIEVLKQQEFWYPVGKTLAEKLVYDYCKAKNLNFACILPTTIQGATVIQKNAHFTLKGCVIDIIKGEDYPLGPVMYHNMVDVQDVVDLHINALEKDVKEGRFIAVGSSYDMNEYGNMLKKICQEEGVEEKIIIKEALPENEMFKHVWIGREETEELLGRQLNTYDNILRNSIRSIKGVFV